MNQSWLKEIDWNVKTVLKWRNEFEEKKKNEEYTPTDTHKCAATTAAAFHYCHRITANQMQNKI